MASRLLLTLASASILSSRALGELVFTNNIGACTYGNAFGTYQYCGRFLDHCYIPDYTENADDCFWEYENDSYCSEVLPEDRPVCAPNQHFSGGRYSLSNSGRGTCKDSSGIGGVSPWQQKNYTYACCDCPPGFISLSYRCDGGDRRGFCAGCNGTGEVPKGIGQYLRCVVPPPPGIACDIVDKLAKQYAITSKAAPTTNGYYHQVLNLACLRSKCTHPACTSVRRFANPDSECKNLAGDWGFEQSVFSKFVTAPDKVALEKLAVQIQEVASIIEDMLQGPLSHNPGLNPTLAALGGLCPPLDLKSIASVIAGSLHFMNDLAGAFSDYINGIWALSCDGVDMDVQGAMEDLTAEHNRLFKCAVIPGFNAEVADGDLPYISGEIAKLAVPIAASMLRTFDIVVASQCLQNAGSGDERRRRRTKRGLKPEDWWLPSDAGIPNSAALRYNIRNWRVVPFGGDIALDPMPGVSTDMAELSVSNKTTTISTQKLLSFLTLQVPPRDNDLEPFWFESPWPPTTPVVSQLTQGAVAIIGPVASIKNPATEIVVINRTSVLGRNVYDTPISYSDAIVVARQNPVRPLSNDTSVLYRKAKLALSYVPYYTQDIDEVDPAKDITIFDLISGKPLQHVLFTTTDSGGVFEAPLDLSNGIWAGSWNGGGMFALGLIKFPPSLSSSIFSTSTTTRKSTTTTTTKKLTSATTQQSTSTSTRKSTTSGTKKPTTTSTKKSTTITTRRSTATSTRKATTISTRKSSSTSARRSTSTAIMKATSTTSKKSASATKSESTSTRKV